ncbi:hypothetical protein [Sigmofec virus UA08Rod_5306]|uniref:Uncharacterized protein n=1 Tax=Sigmofec virus UA08Rod_5306 TaxID=2929417 RepID=A0A976N1K2_9VIRU|nr:hypothetical protein [Sigmofec virus UA08Rod_5306]
MEISEIIKELRKELENYLFEKEGLEEKKHINGIIRIIQEAEETARAYETKKLLKRLGKIKR